MLSTVVVNHYTETTHNKWITTLRRRITREMRQRFNILNWKLQSLTLLYSYCKHLTIPVWQFLVLDHNFTLEFIDAWKSSSVPLNRLSEKCVWQWESKSRRWYNHPEDQKKKREWIQRIRWIRSRPSRLTTMFRVPMVMTTLTIIKINHVLVSNSIKRKSCF